MKFRNKETIVSQEDQDAYAKERDLQELSRRVSRVEKFVKAMEAARDAEKPAARPSV